MSNNNNEFNGNWQKHIDQQVNDTRERISRLEEKIDGIGHAVSDMARGFRDNSRVNWGWIFGGVMLILVAAGMFTTMNTEPIKDQLMLLDRNQYRDYTNLDTILQREMRLLDRALQNEMLPRLEMLEELMHEHQRELGHPHAQTRAIDDLKEMNEVMEKRLLRLEQRLIDGMPPVSKKMSPHSH